MFSMSVPSRRKSKFWFIDVVDDGNGNPTITLPDEMGLMKHWQVGEKIVFVSDEFGNWQILRVDEHEPGNWEIKEKEDDSEIHSS
jgi:hypothetical protein